MHLVLQVPYKNNATEPPPQQLHVDEDLCLRGLALDYGEIDLVRGPFQVTTDGSAQGYSKGGAVVIKDSQHNHHCFTIPIDGNPN